jgi:hypothetical protein
MALIKKLEQLTMDRNSIHEPVSATYTIFTGDDGKKYLQIDTYGSSQRQILGKKSQSIQFGPDTVDEIRSVIDSI